MTINTQNDAKYEDLRPYRKWGLTLLQLMGLLFVTGIVVDVALRYLFY